MLPTRLTSSILRTAAVALTVVWAIVVTAAPATAEDPTYAPDAADFRVVQFVEPSCDVDTVTVRVAYEGDTTEVALVLVGADRAEAAQERVTPGGMVTLTGAPLGFGLSRTYRVNASFLDDHAGVTTLRTFTATRPTPDSCGTAPTTPPPTTGSGDMDGDGDEYGGAPDAADFRVLEIVNLSCRVDRVTVRIAYHGHTTEIGIGLTGAGRGEAAQERPLPDSVVTLTGEAIQFGESRPYRIVTSFADDHSDVTTLRTFTAVRPTAAACGSQPPQLPVTGPGHIALIALSGFGLVAAGALLLIYRRRMVH
jgi:LPXTG-motif cell wall-anchored protein